MKMRSFRVEAITITVTVTVTVTIIVDTQAAIASRNLECTLTRFLAGVGATVPASIN